MINEVALIIIIIIMAITELIKYVSQNYTFNNALVSQQCGYAEGFAEDSLFARNIRDQANLRDW